MKARIEINSFLALSLGLAGCGQSEGPTGTVGLGIGQIAPEIEGKDADGVPFKLSDYRGKVVVLDFWGNW